MEWSGCNNLKTITMNQNEKIEFARKAAKFLKENGIDEAVLTIKIKDKPQLEVVVIGSSTGIHTIADGICKSLNDIATYKGRVSGIVKNN
jgi:hypothetical protein